VSSRRIITVPQPIHHRFSIKPLIITSHQTLDYHWLSTLDRRVIKPLSASLINCCGIASYPSRQFPFPYLALSLTPRHCPFIRRTLTDRASSFGLDPLLLHQTLLGPLKPQSHCHHYWQSPLFPFVEPYYCPLIQFSLRHFAFASLFLLNWYSLPTTNPWRRPLQPLIPLFHGLCSISKHTALHRDPLIPFPFKSRLSLRRASTIHSSLSISYIQRSCLTTLLSSTLHCLTRALLRHHISLAIVCVGLSTD